MNELRKLYDTLDVTKDAYLTSNCFVGSKDNKFRDCLDTGEYLEEWAFEAEDQNDNRYLVTVQFWQVEGEEIDPENLDFENPDYIIDIELLD